MTALSILEMNRTLVAREYAMDDLLKATARPIPDDVCYWHIRRKSLSKFQRKGEQKWVFVCDFTGTKAEVADFWCKHFRGKPGHQLKCVFHHNKVAGRKPS